MRIFSDEAVHRYREKFQLPSFGGGGGGGGGGGVVWGFFLLGGGKAELSYSEDGKEGKGRN